MMKSCNDKNNMKILRWRKRARGQSARLLLKFFPLTLILLVLIYLIYFHIGYRIITDAYYGRSLKIFNRVIQGQKVHPLSFYISLADKYFLLLMAFLFLASVVGATLFLLIGRMKIRVEYDFKKIVISISLSIFLLVSVWILKGEILRARDDFLTLYKLSDDQKRAILLSSGFYKEIKKVRIKIPLNAKILLIPVSPRKLFENDPTRIKLDDYSAVYYFLYPRKIYVYSRHYYKFEDVNKEWLEEKRISWILTKGKTRLIVEKVK